MAEGVERIEEVGVGNDEAEVGRGVTPLLQPGEFEEFIDKKIDEVKAKVTEAVQEALANTLGELLEEKVEGEESKKETEAEELPACPKNLSWLKKMFELLPADILKNSKLWRYRHCVLSVKEAEKEADQ